MVKFLSGQRAPEKERAQKWRETPHADAADNHGTAMLERRSDLHIHRVRNAHPRFVVDFDAKTPCRPAAQLRDRAKRHPRCDWIVEANVRFSDPVTGVLPGTAITIVVESNHLGFRLYQLPELQSGVRAGVEPATAGL